MLAYVMTFAYIGIAIFVVFLVYMMFRGDLFITEWTMWARLTTMGGVAIMLFLGVYFGHEEATKSEKTLMTVCWGFDRQAHYQDDLPEPLCAAPSELVWPKKIKNVYWDLPKEFDVYEASYNEAIKYWNREMGSKIFAKTIYKVKADIIITEGSANYVGQMSTSHTKDAEGVISSRILVNNPGNIRRFMLELQHELGHCLGLAHDRGSSIMNKTMTEPENTLRVWFITAKDKKRLRAVMGL